MLALSGTASALQVTEALPCVACDGRVCGGSGGESSSPFLYRIVPGESAITSFEVGIEDADLAHYGDFVLPAGWEVDVEAVALPHDEHPSAHGTRTGRAGAVGYHLARRSKEPGT